MERVIISHENFNFFGASELPELARSMGRASGEFKKAHIEVENEVRSIKTLDGRNIRRQVQKLAETRINS